MDETEDIRRQMVQEINSKAGERATLEERHGQVWDTKELQARLRSPGLHGADRGREATGRRQEGQPRIPAQPPVLLQLPDRQIILIESC
jgi:hypothetical protein